MGKFAIIRGIRAAAVLAVCGSVAVAATEPPDPLLPRNIDQLHIDDLIASDPLGETCIEEKNIDVAFHATGKGLRMPRTCLPEPCAQAMTSYRLASLIGRRPTADEWETYFTRYADFCRKETIAFGDDAAEKPGTGLSPAASFWVPLLSGFENPKPTRRVPGVTPTSGSGPTLLGGTPSGGGGPVVLSSGGGGSDGGGGTSPGGSVAAVPLPAPFLLMLAALLGLLGLGRRRAA